MIVAAGTSYHAGVVGRYIIEEWARVPVEPDIASEWIYRNPVLSKDTLVIGISQSGESRDTVNAVKLARESGARTLAITNLMGTQITREVDATLYTRCGMEVGVAASKTFTAQVALLSLLALKLAEIRRTLPQEEIEFILDRLHELPAPACRSSSTASTRSTRSRSASTTRRSSSTSAATSACPSRSRARSS